jgi:hypothetical protein
LAPLLAAAAAIVCRRIRLVCPTTPGHAVATACVTAGSACTGKVNLVRPTRSTFLSTRTAHSPASTTAVPWRRIFYTGWYILPRRKLGAGRVRAHHSDCNQKKRGGLHTHFKHRKSSIKASLVRRTFKTTPSDISGVSCTVFGSVDPIRRSEWQRSASDHLAATGGQRKSRLNEHYGATHRRTGAVPRACRAVLEKISVPDGTRGFGSERCCAASATFAISSEA